MSGAYGKHDAGIDRVSTRKGGADIFHDKFIGLLGRHDGVVHGHGKGLVDSYRIGKLSALHTTVPVVGRHPIISQHDISIYIGFPVGVGLVLVAAGIGFEYAVLYGTSVLQGRDGAGFEVVVDDVVLRIFVASVDGTVPPVVYDTVYKIELPFMPMEQFLEMLEA